MLYERWKKAMRLLGTLFDSFLLSYSTYHDIQMWIFILRQSKNLQFISFLLLLSFNCSYESSHYNSMSSCYSISLQEETWILFHCFSRLNNLEIYKLEKEKPITPTKKTNIAV